MWSIEENPSLKPQLDDILVRAYKKAKIQALKETKLAQNTFPVSCPWKMSQILDDDFYPNAD